MSRIDKMKEFIATCPFMDKFAEQHIDWTEAEPGNYGIAPTGESIIRTERDVLGSKKILKQSNFSLYARCFTIDDIARLETIGFLENFADWIEEQSEKGLAPQFGDDPEEEEMTAQNGMLFKMSENGQSGLYQIQIQCFYVKYKEENNG